MKNLLADDALMDRIAGAVAEAVTLDDALPWLRLTEPGRIEVHADFDREQWLADPSGRARYLSIGAALLNLRLAVRYSGLRPSVQVLTGRSVPPTLVASVLLEPGTPPTPTEGELFDAIGSPRHALPWHSGHLSERIRASLEQAARAEHATLRLLTGPEAARLRGLIAAEERELADGSRPAGHAARTARRGHGLGVVLTPGDSPADWLRAGQALQLVLLVSAVHLLAASALYEPVEVHDMLNEASWWTNSDRPQVLVQFGQ